MIGKLELSDLEEIYKLQTESYPQEVWDSVEDTKSFFTWPIIHGIKDNNILKAVVFGYVEKDLFHIYSVEVSKDCRKSGVGSRLVEFCIDYARSQNLKKVRAYGFSDGGKKLLQKHRFTKISEKKYLQYVMDVMILDL